MKFKSIRAKLIVVLVTFFLISFTALSATGYYFARRGITQNVESAIDAIALDYAHRLQAHVNEMMTQISFLASLQRVRTGENREQILEAMRETHQRLGVFDTILFVWPDGSAMRWDDVEPFDNGDRDYVQQVLRTGKPYVGQVVISRARGNPVVPLAVPVIYDGKLNGVLAATYNLERLSEFLSLIKFKNTGYGYLLDSVGRVLGNPRLPETVWKLNLNERRLDPSLGFRNAELSSEMIGLYQKSLESTDTPVYGSFVFADGLSQFGVFSPVNLAGGQRWTLAVMAPESEVMEELNLLTRAMLTMSVLFVILATIFTLFLSGNISRPISVIRDQFMFLAEGDLTERQVDITSNDEVGQLAKCFLDMRHNIHDIIIQVQDQAEQVSGSSQELTAGSQKCASLSALVSENVAEVRAGTGKQAASAKRIVDISENMSKDTSQALEVAQEILGLAVNTSDEATHGKQAVERAVIQMKQIGEGSAAVHAAVNELAKGSNEISEIVNLISSIAGQTNLLALNAAIEAARAGEHGKGFAVVAEEVRKLAESSNLAAKQIGELITHNQHNMDNAITAITTGEEGVQAGVDVVNAAGDTFAKIAAGINSLSAQIKRISDYIGDLVSASSVLNQSIQEISSVTQHNAAEVGEISEEIKTQAASIDEIAKSSQNLAEMAYNLRGITSKFTV
ncbi:MAG: methyl-accepting chemotaxis protein [Synergistaceae bacterium]|nr:methyl-accepting chemotaxis protein [Synergistaceae bacterium]